MKRSIYNLFVTMEDGRKIAFNSLSCALAEADKDFIGTLDNIENLKYDELTDEDKQYVDQLLKANYIVNNDDLDELKVIEHRHYSGKYQENELSLTIAPTLACNFKCTYCFENPKNGIMGEDVQEAIIDWVKAETYKRRNIRIIWFGGEPLLAMDVVYNLSKKIAKICEENQCDFSNSMATNGYKLDIVMIERLKEIKIQGIQITIDGPAHIHNKRRMLKADNGETFDRIINNLVNLKENGINFSIRINVDKTNFDYVDELLDVLDSKGLKDVPVNLGQVTSYTEVCRSIADSCLDMKEFAKVDSQFLKLLWEKGIRSRDAVSYPSIRSSFCSSDRVSAYAVDPSGYLYKCWNDIGEIDASVGHINNRAALSEYALKNMLKYMTWGPFKQKECVECNMLPVCMGGCPFNGAKENKPQCEKWKYNIKEILKYKFMSKTLGEGPALNTGPACG